MHLGQLKCMFSCCSTKNLINFGGFRYNMQAMQLEITSTPPCYDGPQ